MIAPSPPDRGGEISPGLLRPSDYNPEMAKARFAEVFFSKLSPFLVVSKKFIVYYGLWKALNNSERNQTGYDSTMRIELYEFVSGLTPHIEGKALDMAGTYVNSANVVVQQITPPAVSQFDKEPSFMERVKGRLFGGGQSEPAKP